MNKKWLIIFFLLGLIYRILLILFFPQPFIFDQLEYHRFALGILEKGLYAESARLYGYPLFLAVIYRLFGVNRLPVFIIQAALDTTVALLLFQTARKIFKSTKAAGIAGLLYLINPMTALASGLLLTEAVTIFFVPLIFLTYLNFEEKKGIGKAFFLGLLIGFLPQIRPSFFIFSLGFVLVVIINLLRHRLEVSRKLLLGSVIIIFYFLPFTYNLIGNQIYFHQFSLLTVDNLMAREAYLGLYLRSDSFGDLPNNVRRLYDEYSTPKTGDERKNMADKYLNGAIQDIKRNPVEYLMGRIKRSWSGWQKQSLLVYQKPQKEWVGGFIIGVNLLFLTVSLLGYMLFLREKKYPLFSLLVFWLFLTITVVHAFTAADERYSLPFYPLLFLLAGNFWTKFIKALYKEIKPYFDR